jgi:hypothetical protein
VALFLFMVGIMSDFPTGEEYLKLQLGAQRVGNELYAEDILQNVAPRTSPVHARLGKVYDLMMAIVDRDVPTMTLS